MCKQSIHQRDWWPLGNGNLWPPRSPLTCEPGRHKLLTATTTTTATELVNGVASGELWARTHAHSALAHMHMHTLTHKHIHRLRTTPPWSINIAFSSWRTSTEGRWSGSITACLVYRQQGYVLMCTMSHCHFDLTQGSSKGRYHTFVKYYLRPDISSIHL